MVGIGWVAGGNPIVNILGIFSLEKKPTMGLPGGSLKMVMYNYLVHIVAA